MKAFEASIEINATPERIWEILVDAPRYPEWEPGVIGIDGVIAPGQKLTVRSKLNPGRAFPVKVDEFTPGRRMTWVGGMPLGLFKGVRSFTIAGNRFTLREEFSGLMLPLIWPSIPDMSAAFQGFVEGLKARAEQA